MAGILYANIRRRLTITLARGKRLTKKKKNSNPDETEEPSASQTFGQQDLLRLCRVESATRRLFFSQGRKVNSKIDRTAENVITPPLSRPKGRTTVLYVKKIHMCRAANTNANESDLQKRIAPHTLLSSQSGTFST